MRSDLPRFNSSEMFPNNIFCRPQLQQQQQQQRNVVNINSLGLFTTMDQSHDISKEDTDSDIHIHVDMGLFSPEELTVQIVNDQIVIEGKHEERNANDVSFISRQFIRRYELPKDYNPDTMVSKLSSDGILRVLWPKIQRKPKERMVAIQQEGPNNHKNKSVKVVKDDAMNEVEEGGEGGQGEEGGSV